MAPSVLTVAKLAFLSFGAVISAAAVDPRNTPISEHPVSEQGSCTVTAFHVPNFNLNPVETVWNTTVTSTISLDCGSCSHATSTDIPIGHGPEVNITKTVTATVASTAFAYACGTSLPAYELPTATSSSASQGEPNHDVVVAFPSSPLLKNSTSDHRVVAASQTVPSVPSVPSQQGELHHRKAAGYRRSEDDNENDDNENDDTDMPTHAAPTPPFASRGITSTLTAPGFPSPTCTTTYALAPNRPRATLIIYPSTVTHTSRVYCGPCALVWSTNLSDLPTTPMVHVATKTTKKPATETHLKCHKFTVKTTKTPTASTTSSTITDAAAASPPTATTGENEMESDPGDQDETDDEENDDDDG